MVLPLHNRFRAQPAFAGQDRLFERGGVEGAGGLGRGLGIERAQWIKHQWGPTFGQANDFGFGFFAADTDKVTEPIRMPFGWCVPDLPATTTVVLGGVGRYDWGLSGRAGAGGGVVVLARAG